MTTGRQKRRRQQKLRLQPMLPTSRTLQMPRLLGVEVVVSRPSL